MENNNCILLTKKEYEELKAKAAKNNPEIRICCTYNEGAFFAPKVITTTSTTFEVSERLSTFIHRIANNWTNKINSRIEQQVKDGVARQVHAVTEGTIKSMQEEIDFYKNRGFISRLFNTKYKPLSD